MGVVVHARLCFINNELSTQKVTGVCIKLLIDKQVNQWLHPKIRIDNGITDGLVKKD